MSIYVIGINHKTAPIAVREKVYFALDKVALYLQDLLSCGHAREAVLISTCNRSELYCEADEVNSVRDWFYAQANVPRAELEAVLYIYRDAEAVAHIMQVACGLDSMVLGEPQILGQMKEAFSESCSAGAVDASFHRLFQEVFTVAKEIRASTDIGACPVSVASAATQFAKQQIADFSNARIALVGAGDTTELLIRYLQRLNITYPLTVVNRSREKAAHLAATYGCQVFGLEQLPFVLAQSDIVFSATGSAVPLITPATFANIQPKPHPVVLIDIAVPRDIDPAVANLPQAKLFCIDDLKTIIEQNRRGREHAADKAQELIREKSTHFITEITSLDKVTHAIRVYRGQIEALCQAELLKSKQQLLQGADPGQVLETFAHAFTNKLLHAPSVQLRQAGMEGRFELLRYAKQLFGLPDPETELS